VAWLLVLAVLLGAGAVTARVVRHTAPSPVDPTAGTQHPSDGGVGACSRQVRVLTAASYAPVLREVAASLASGADCVAVHVTVADGIVAAAAVASSRADVWIPDDQSWPQLPNTLSLAPGAGSVIATSPLYLVTLRSGRQLPATARSTVGLGTELGSPGPWHLVVRDPVTSGDGMVAVGALATGVGAAKGPLVSALDMMRAWRAGSTSSASGAALPTRAGQVAVVPEYALLAVPRVGDYTAAAFADRTALMRYSWFPTAAAVARPQLAAALDRLHQALTAPTADRALSAAGLRSAVWPAAAPKAAARAGLPAITARPMPVLSEHWMYHVLSTWEPALRRANMLVVIDVSGSMAERAPGATSAKIDLVRQGLTQAVALLPANSRLGLWQFGSQLAPPNDWQTVVSVANLNTAQRTRIARAGAALHARPTGTGLYDTILAAYRDLQAHYQTGIPNEVLVLTDGINRDDPSSISLTQLQAGLAATDHTKRVQLSIFGFGAAVPTIALGTALGPVDGQVDQLNSGEQAIGAFVHAVSGGLSGNSG
jgi:Bacterial extracellular solute-binding protein/von Willebrand factor type A domain